MADPIKSELEQRGFADLQREAANSAIVRAALDHIATNGSRSAEAETSWSLSFTLSWMPADLSEIIERRGAIG